MTESERCYAEIEKNAVAAFCLRGFMATYMAHPPLLQKQSLTA